MKIPFVPLSDIEKLIGVCDKAQSFELSGAQAIATCRDFLPYLILLAKVYPALKNAVNFYGNEENWLRITDNSTVSGYREGRALSERHHPAARLWESIK